MSIISTIILQPRFQRKHSQHCREIQTETPEKHFFSVDRHSNALVIIEHLITVFALHIQFDFLK